MPIPGPTVHQQLMDAYKDLQAQLESVRDEILQKKDHRDQLDDERIAALASLAEHYLPELTGEAIDKTWVAVRDEIPVDANRSIGPPGVAERDVDQDHRQPEPSSACSTLFVHCACGEASPRR